ncbi:RsbRD N-terminal domain-containing protein, partial [bacterium]|nr:RsbRD N-terminal domain-containing protein [bacterium]
MTKRIPHPRELLDTHGESLADFLEASIDQFLDEWTQAAQEGLHPAETRSYSPDELRNNLSHLLSEVVSILRNEKSFDELTSFSLQHLEQRWSMGWKLNELISDYQLLRH